MTKRMLIDATHAEETRVVILDGNRLEDFDVETAAKAQLKGNIYLAKIVRVEPSLQAAFVEYGGGRHGFLAFGEIHPDYYQIPVADRQRLLEMQEAEARAEEEAEDAAAEAAASADELAPPLPVEEDGTNSQAAAIAQDFLYAADRAADLEDAPSRDDEPQFVPSEESDPVQIGGSPDSQEASAAASVDEHTHAPAVGDGDLAASDRETEESSALHGQADADADAQPEIDAEPEEADDEAGHGATRHDSRPPARFMRSYKIQEVIRRRQILLVQVVKEERGTKGAALTTFVSLAGRFCVLMPNSPRGGGISRKITSAADRRRLKEVTAELQIPRGMGLIVRTAGAARPKAEIRRDCEYLLELWDSIRETTMASIAPALIHEEASLIKRAIRDNYSRDVDEVLVDGEQGWRAARDFMRMLMPAHARKVILWNEAQPLFARHGVETHLDSMLQPTVQLRSGGYLVINQTEALVAIDVNSGRSTRERGIEETALKTNLEAADEVARQLRLRDLAGLVVIDFIDMESRRNNTVVEKRMKDALRDDRARIQLGSISHFGLMELSRQRLRPSLTETSFTVCPHCGGSGLIRTTETASLAVLRAIEEEGAKRRAAAIVVHVAGSVALYVLNNKRARLAEIEQRYAMTVTFAADESLLPPQTRIERTRPQTLEALPLVTPPHAVIALPPEDDLAIEDADEEDEEEEADGEAGDEPVAAVESAEEGDAPRRKRRRRRRGGRREDAAPEDATPDDATPDDATLGQTDAAQGIASFSQPELDIQATPPAATLEASEPGADDRPAGVGASEAAAEDEAKSRRRGRRGGRRRRREVGDNGSAAPEPDAEQQAAAQPPAPPAYTGPTPANPFGGEVFDIFDMMDEAHDVEPPRPRPAVIAAPTPDSDPVPQQDPTEPSADPEPLVLAGHAPAEPAPQEAASDDAPSVEAAAHPAITPIDAGPALDAEPELVMNAAVPPPLLIGTELPAEKKRGWWKR